MRLTVLGSSGSVASPDNPASGYHLCYPGMPGLILDIGSGVLAAMQDYGINPSDNHVVLSHLHADHCSDFPSLMVWRRFHPFHKATRMHTCIGPAETPLRMGLASANSADNYDDMSDTLDFIPWKPGTAHTLDFLTCEAFPAIHPIETYSIRITSPEGHILAYSADSASNPNLIHCARNADLFLCEATWGRSSQDKEPNMHLSAKEAAIIATRAQVKHLVLCHIPPWVDPEECVDAAAQEFDGPIDIALSGKVFDIKHSV